MKPICTHCFSSDTYPVSSAKNEFPESLQPTLLSPSVLGRIGLTVCKQTNIPPIVGLVLGTLVGLALTRLTESSPVSYYCRQCNHVFDVSGTTAFASPNSARL